MKDNRIIFSLLLNALALLITDRLFDSITISDGFTLVVLTLILALLNTYFKPVLVILTFPVTILSLGLFLLIINGLILWLASLIIDGFSIASFGGAVWGALAFSILNILLEKILAR